MEPTFNDYVALIYNRFEAFVQASPVVPKVGHPWVYQQQRMIVFFMMMQFKRIYHFKSQWRWLKLHPEVVRNLEWKSVPDRSTLSRRYKALYPLLVEFVQFLGCNHEALGEELRVKQLYEDKSLFKAQGPVWHQKDRQAGRIPEKLRHLDREATWAKSAYHGWVYGYGLHLTCNASGFPVLMQVESAAYDETCALQDKEERILKHFQPETFCADDAYTQALRIRRWAQQGVILLTPALRWRNGRYAQAYRRFIRQPEMASLLRTRKISIEPIFDLMGKLLGVTGRQKQLTLQRLPNSRSCLGLAVLSLQFAMLANSVWSLPFRSISTLRAVFA
jgi:hypothetical protein